MNCHKQGCSFYDEQMTDFCSKGEPPDVLHCPIRMGSKRGLRTYLDEQKEQIAQLTVERDRYRTALEMIADNSVEPYAVNKVEEALSQEAK